MDLKPDFRQSEYAGKQLIPLCRGVRGATTVEDNDREEILAATRELLFIMIKANGIEQADVASAIFTTTIDLNATYPALAARQMGWYDAALLCGHEMNVPGGLTKCVRILIHWNTLRSAEEIVHVYLRGAKKLRPDRNELPPITTEEIQAAIDIENFDLIDIKQRYP
jgi:chorismate mutase